MEANGFCSNDDHGDIDTSLPPRKRLLAGLKRQSSQTAFSSSRHLSYFGKTPEEVIEDSISAAKAAAVVAAAAKAAALEKAAAAARAFAAAKRALELVASLDEDMSARGNSVRKQKKQVPIKLLYKGRRLKNENDEELARRLHRAINSSPRISNHSVTSNREKQGKRKPSELPKHKQGLICEGNSYSDRNVDGGDGDRAMLSSSDRQCQQKLEEKTAAEKGGDFEEKNETQYSKKNCCNKPEAGTLTSGKKARIKQKKLSLSLCSIRDLEKPKAKPDCSGPSEPPSNLPPRDIPSFAAKHSNEADEGVEATPSWSCKDFRAPQCFVESKMLDPLASKTTAVQYLQ
ncbi:uncharacterized protein [Aristolochia californica]|uniref:uncharacterized protein n=1 Tax=Aristolochia californica TaxID=171875 RepID=UPI0035DFFB9A